MRIKLDENLSRHLKKGLIEFGHEVATAADENLLGKADADVAAAAKSENMIVLHRCCICRSETVSSWQPSWNCLISSGKLRSSHREPFCVGFCARSEPLVSCW